MRWCVLLFALAASIPLTACGIRKPQTPCEWTDASAPVSLLDDIKKAEDISIRHGDAMAYGNVRRAARQRCEATLFAAIAASRGISVDAVYEARRELDRRGFDWLVNVPMAAFALTAAFVMLRNVGTRFFDDRLARFAATVLVSVALGIVVIGVGQVWAFTVELVRIGNSHLSYRGLRIPWGHHRLATFALTVASTWVIAAFALRTRYPGT